MAKKICFKKTFSDGSLREAEGVPYTTKNGIKVALHKEGKFWQATELTTGKLIIERTEGEPTIKAVKAKVEERSNIVAKLLKKTKVTPAKSQPAKAQAPKTTTYTVKGKTFATLAEAKAFKALQKQNAGKPCEIKEGTRKPTHKVVSFTAKHK